MPEEKNNNNLQFDEASKQEFQKLLDKENIKIPQAGDIVKGTVLSASKAEVKLDIGGITTGVVRGREPMDGRCVLWRCLRGQRPAP